MYQYSPDKMSSHDCSRTPNSKRRRIHVLSPSAFRAKAVQNKYRRQRASPLSAAARRRLISHVELAESQSDLQRSRKSWHVNSISLQRWTACLYSAHGARMGHALYGSYYFYVTAAILEFRYTRSYMLPRRFAARYAPDPSLTPKSGTKFVVF